MHYNFQKKTDEQLIRVIESPDAYHPTAIEAAQVELSKRSIPNDEVMEMAKAIFTQKVRHLLAKTTLSFEEHTLPQTTLIEPATRLELFKEIFNDFATDRELFYEGLDSYLYDADRTDIFSNISTNDLPERKSTLTSSSIIQRNTVQSKLVQYIGLVAAIALLIWLLIWSIIGV